LVYIRGAAYLACAVMSVVTFALFGADKRRARAGAYRVPERTLLLCALFLGAPGALIGMRHFRHKTRKPLFRTLASLALLANIALFALLHA
jgi:uncharacterized membrane protein YsdA (DUF1294 family)